MDDQKFQLQPGTHLAAFDVSTKAPTYLAQLSNHGQMQLSERLYHLLSCLDTPKSITELAASFSQRTGVRISEDVVQHVIIQVLMPRRLIISTIGSGMSAARGADQQDNHLKPAQPGKRSLLALHLKQDVLPAKVLVPLTRVLQCLYNPILVTVLILAGLALHVSAYWQLGIPPQLSMQGVSWPLVYVLVVLSILVHELGHLSACRRWHCKHGSLGIALYFFMPAFYVNVSQAWRLPRWQRVVVDLGGIYFQLIFTTILIAAYWLTRHPIFLWATMLIDVTMLVNLNPLFKLDGYWVLSDAFGIANLHKRSWELLCFGVNWVFWKLRLRSIQPATSTFEQFQPMVVCGLVWYTTLAINLWMLTLALLIPLIFRVVTTYPTVALNAVTGLQVSLSTSDWILMVVAFDSLFLPTLMVINFGIVIGRMSWSLLDTTFRVTRKMYEYF